HRDTTIPFRGGVYAISGANGAGKSTILDAIVYALYGPDGLGLATRTDTVVREGATERQVTLRFEVGGDTYRIVRTRRITGGGKTTLELVRHVGDSWASLTKGTVRETQALIVELLGTTGEAFLRTVHVGQGEATAFARAT